VIDQAIDLSGVFADDGTPLPQRLARYLLDADADADPGRDEGSDPRRLLVVLNSAHDPRAVSLLRERIGERILQPLQAGLAGAQAGRNAALTTAFLIGFGYLHLLLELPALRGGDRDGLPAALARVIEAAASGR
jgi:hypothetical protein